MVRGDRRGEGRQPLTENQQRIAAAYYEAALRRSARVKKEIRSRRRLSQEEEDAIDDLTVDTLHDFARQAGSAGYLFNQCFSQLERAAKGELGETTRRSRRTTTLHDEDGGLLYDTPEPHSRLTTPAAVEALLEEFDPEDRVPLRSLLHGDPLPTEEAKADWRRRRPRLRAKLEVVYDYNPRRRVVTE